MGILTQLLNTMQMHSTEILSGLTLILATALLIRNKQVKRYRTAIKQLSESKTKLESKIKSLETENQRLKLPYHEKLRKEYYYILTQKFNYWFGAKMLPKYLAGGASKVTSAEIKKIIEKFNKDFFSTTNPKLLEDLIKYIFSSKEAIEITNKEFFYTKLNEYELKNLGALTTDDNIAANAISKE